MRELDPHPFHGCRPAGELRPSRDADGARADRVPALHADDAPRPGPSGLARARPLRPLLRPRLDAPVLDAVPVGLRRHARPDQGLPPARVALRGSSGVRPRARRGDDHRPARPGHLDRRRHGAGRAHAGRPLQPRRAHPDRPPHLLHRLRRRPRGGDLLRGVLARRSPRAREADRLLRRQPHLDRGRHRARVLRGRRRALRGLRLARAEPRRGDRAGRARGGARRGPGGRGPAEPDHRPHAHRARLAEQAGHARRARLAARRGGDPADQGGLRLPEPGALLRRPTRRSSTSAAPSSAAASSTRSGTRRSPPIAPRSPTRPPSSSASSRARCPPASATTCRARARTPA